MKYPGQWRLIAEAVVATMSSSSEFVEFITDMLQLFGVVSAKQMFGGYGLYLDGIMFALVADDTLYFKADDISKSDFEQKGLMPFTYAKNGTQYKMSYYCAPEEVLEDSELMCGWANKAYDAAVRVHKAKQRTA